MTEEGSPTVPADLLVVGLVLAFYGAASVVDMLASLWVGPFHFSFGFICLPLGHGLLRLSRWERNFAVAALILKCLFVVALLLLPLAIRWAEVPFSGANPFVWMGLVLAFCAWGVYVIDRRSRQGIFADAPPKGGSRPVDLPVRGVVRRRVGRVGLRNGDDRP